MLEDNSTIGKAYVGTDTRDDDLILEVITVTGSANMFQEDWYRSARDGHRT